jgi:hypothetical protein
MYETVTTFSKKGWEEYGKTFLDSYVKFWSFKIHVYWEGKDHPDGYPKDKVCWHDLSKDTDRRSFLETYADKTSKDYRFNATRFCHKVYAFTDPKRKAKQSTKHWVWLDADVETTAPVSKQFLDSVCPAGFSGSYLGRKDWHHSELGFLSVHKSAWSYLKHIRQEYNSGKIFEYDEWHDSYIFDQIKDEHGWWYNISEGVPGMHVWDDCPLGEVMIHKKGPLRKVGENSDAPGYQSTKESVGTVGDSQMLVKTKNCVEDQQIQANIQYSATVGEKYLPMCELAPEAVCVLVSAGPSLEEQLPLIKELSEKPNHYVVAVKHAISLLEGAGIPVWACILLDPRPHVADFVDDSTDESTRFFVASMCHPSTFDKLAKREYYIYHAHVGAGEQEVLADRLGKETFMISGGCSTATRGIGVMRLLGFRQFKLFSYDFCYFEEPDMEELDKYGNQKNFEIEISGRKFWADAEKIAQAQDFQTIMTSMEDMHFEVFGPGVAPHMFNTERKLLPKFTDIF